MTRSSRRTTARPRVSSIALANIKYEQNSSWDQFQLSASSNPPHQHAVDHARREVCALQPRRERAGQCRQLSLAREHLGHLDQDAALRHDQLAAQGNWSFYGQYAQGMYVPDLSSFYTPYDRHAAQSAPRCRGEAADLHQLSDRHRLAWPQGLGGLDGYIINVNNKIATDTDTTASGALVNIGSVHYKGVEGQVAYMPIRG
jgi:iron complex outermembrane receptor protein